MAVPDLSLDAIYIRLIFAVLVNWDSRVVSICNGCQQMRASCIVRMACTTGKTVLIHARGRAVLTAAKASLTGIWPHNPVDRVRRLKAPNPPHPRYCWFPLSLQNRPAPCHTAVNRGQQPASSGRFLSRMHVMVRSDRSDKNSRWCRSSWWQPAQ